ncbi:MAG TPA: NAD(P)-binding oxidoreductase [Thermoanaerobaculia bacterium]
MRILVTRGSGVIGIAAIEELVQRRHHVRLLSRDGDDHAKRWTGVEAFPADVTDAASVHGAADGCDAVLHIAGVSADVVGTRNIVAEAVRAGARRFVYVSSLDHQSKREAEAIVAGSELRWTIVRPRDMSTVPETRWPR